MKGHGEKFGRKKEEAIAALLSHKSVEDAAIAIGLDPNTLLRWMQRPEFRRAYLKARSQAVTQAIARLQKSTGVAGLVLLNLIHDSKVPPAVRLRAAEAIFNLALKGIEIEDILERLNELERAKEEAEKDKN